MAKVGGSPQETNNVLLQTALSQFGLNGSPETFTTGAQTGAWFAVQIITDTTFTKFNEMINAAAADVTALQTTIAAGTIIYGDIRALTASSGVYRCYRNNALYK